MKVFISQPMNGKSEEEILEERKYAIADAKRRFSWFGDDVEIIDSYLEDYNPTGGCIALKYLAKSIELLADADVAYFMKGWKDARGCKIEFECAKAYGVNYIAEG